MVMLIDFNEILPALTAKITTNVMHIRAGKPALTNIILSKSILKLTPDKSFNACNISMD